ncbi:DUF1850 domain-containing protein [Thauera aromatica]|uniref:DUF1850 domain-containing protein n=1 Tax=Thauera aromatica K172 TaxID=44139 RepID=A0A2R4BN30_THAAR|nr:DUF1850 domain-containing protein [Thauera aromatica]AVR88745.1 DUF1850 domain-containing protein [Thauera aromatica K172]MCK2096100.1 DUF1850 domain-containing protein [Thauera aromatica]
MIGICLATGVASAALAVNAFTLAWTHSIEKVRWEERWRVEAAALVLEAVRVRGFGAGMEPPAEAVLRDGVWEWQPGSRHAVLRLTRSGYTADYEWCGGEGEGRGEAGCVPLSAILPADGGVTELRPCTMASPPAPGPAPAIP